MFQWHSRRSFPHFYSGAEFWLGCTECRHIRWEICSWSGTQRRKERSGYGEWANKNAQNYVSLSISANFRNHAFVFSTCVSYLFWRASSSSIMCLHTLPRQPCRLLQRSVSGFILFCWFQMTIVSFRSLEAMFIRRQGASHAGLTSSKLLLDTSSLTCKLARLTCSGSSKQLTNLNTRQSMKNTGLTSAYIVLSVLVLLLAAKAELYIVYPEIRCFPH